MADKYTMEQLGDDMTFVKGQLTNIHKCLHGDESDPESLGLVDLVRENTKFRKRATGWLVAFGSMVSGLFVEGIWAWIAHPKG